MSEHESPPRDNDGDISDDFDFDIPDAYVENLEKGNVENLDSNSINLDMQMSAEQVKRIIIPPSMPAQVR